MTADLHISIFFICESTKRYFVSIQCSYLLQLIKNYLRFKSFFPFGIFRILLAGRRSKQLNLLLGAVHPAYQNRGLDTIMGSAMLESARQGKREYIDSHLEMESNVKVRAEMEYMGGNVYKTFRIFGKSIKTSNRKSAFETLSQMAKSSATRNTRPKLLLIPINILFLMQKPLLLVLNYQKT